jgi:phage host-nuclease inhibitor protein Gam
MFGKRKKELPTPLLSEQELEEQAGKYAAIESELMSLQAQLDKEVQVIRDKYLGKIAALEQDKDEVMKLILFWAQSNREVFEKKKSRELLHARIGFRMGTPKLKTRKGFTWASVTQLLKEFAPDYIRLKEEPDKELLIAHREDAKIPELYEKIGIECVQEESFFIEPKTEEVIK